MECEIGSDSNDHDFGGFNESGGGLPGLESHFTGGRRGDDRRDLLFANRDFYFRHQPADAHTVDPAHKLVSAADSAQYLPALGNSFAPRAIEQTIDFALGNSMMPSCRLDAPYFSSVNPLLDGGEADVEFESGFAEFQ